MPEVRAARRQVNTGFTRGRVLKVDYFLPEKIMGRGILLWMLGVPIPIILLLALCSHS
jgi:hypothetical protein